jgi:hypothetical protein
MRNGNFEDAQQAEPKRKNSPSIRQVFVKRRGVSFLVVSVFGLETVLSAPNPKLFRRLAALVER